MVFGSNKFFLGVSVALSLMAGHMVTADTNDFICERSLQCCRGLANPYTADVLISYSAAGYNPPRPLKLSVGRMCRLVGATPCRQDDIVSCCDKPLEGKRFLFGSRELYAFSCVKAESTGTLAEPKPAEPKPAPA
ncbi:hypothetical protein BJ165DRAFT_1526771 [Panaeolus papilionaceus]|nr:hypothetical protein BJ165DRAFT_1526771 [Panaeolus papilionaceus]